MNELVNFWNIIVESNTFNFDNFCGIVQKNECG